MYCLKQITSSVKRTNNACLLLYFLEYSISEPAKLYMRMPGTVLAAFSDAQFINEQFTLKPGETIFMYTDGVTEAMNREHKLFGEERLVDLIKREGNIDIPNLLKETNKGVADFVNGNEQSDD